MRFSFVFITYKIFLGYFITAFQQNNFTTCPSCTALCPYYPDNAITADCVPSGCGDHASDGWDEHATSLASLRFSSPPGAMSSQYCCFSFLLSCDPCSSRPYSCCMKNLCCRAVARDFNYQHYFSYCACF
jgi:hypothetical protein